MAPLSAGILMWRRRGETEVLLVHFGGPQWRGKDEGAWGIPKGLAEPGEDLEACARRDRGGRSAPRRSSCRRTARPARRTRCL